MTEQLSPEEQQERWLEEGKAVVKQQSFLMKRALDNSNLRDGLKYGSNMLCELRTGLLSPKNFYELYIMVADEMRHLEAYFYDEFKRGRRMVELYELVQHAGNIVPRLFLLITVGSVYVRSKEAPARDILKDLVEMCRGVQHPMRGLFLRNYLLQCTRDKLPDVGGEYGTEVADSVDYLMHNFSEMNKLWVRMQHQGPVRNRERREKERLDLRILVGMNLVRLSNLEGVDAEMYKSTVLPRILEQVVSCKDQIAQQYLMECIIQVFPDEFHLRTLTELLETCGELQSGVDLKTVLIALMNRLAAFAKAEPASIPSDVDMLAIFQENVAKISAANLPLAGLLDLQVALVNFALGLAPEKLDYVDSIFASCGTTLAASAEGGRVDGPAKHAVVSLLKTPVLSTGKPLAILALPHYAQLMAFLPLDSRKEVAVLLARILRSGGAPIGSVGETDAVLGFLQPLVMDAAEDAAAQAELDDDVEEFDQEQSMVAALIHQLRGADSAQQFAIFVAARKHFGQGGARRIKYTLPAVAFQAFALATRVRGEEDAGAEPGVASKKIFGFALETVKGLASAEPTLALKLFLQGAQAANNCGEDRIAYEFVSQAFELYEEEISDSKVQLELVLQSAGTLYRLHKLDPEDYDTLITSTTKHAARLLKKPDQCRAVYVCSHLFWNDALRQPAEEGAEQGELAFHDGKRVLDCLQRSLKIADVCMQAASSVHLFVEILNRYLFYFEADNDKVTVKYLQGLVDLVKENLATLQDGADAEPVRAHFARTLTHVQAKTEVDADRFAALAL